MTSSRCFVSFVVLLSVLVHVGCNSSTHAPFPPANLDPDRTEIQFFQLHAILRSEQLSLDVIAVRRNEYHYVNNKVVGYQFPGEYDSDPNLVFPDDHKDLIHVNASDTRLSMREIPSNTIALFYFRNPSVDTTNWCFTIDYPKEVLRFSNGQEVALPAFDGSCYLVLCEGKLQKLDFSTFALWPYMMAYESEWRALTRSNPEKRDIITGFQPSDSFLTIGSSELVSVIPLTFMIFTDTIIDDGWYRLISSEIMALRDMPE
jgi:hypothetical protein